MPAADHLELLTNLLVLGEEEEEEQAGDGPQAEGLLPLQLQPQLPLHEPVQQQGQH